jgi:hypothetical protein
MADADTADHKAVEKSAKTRRNCWFAVGLIVALALIFVVNRESTLPEQLGESRANAISQQTLIQLTPEQVKQIHVELVREQTIDLNLEASGKRAFNEDHLIPVLAPYSGRVVEVLAK